MKIPRRFFLKSAAASVAALAWAPSHSWSAAVPPKIRIGTCRLGLADAKLAGLDGVEVQAGKPEDTLEIASPEVRARYKAQMKETGLVVSSIMMSQLNSNPLASDPRGPAWLEQTIEGARDLGAKIILVAFFGKGNLLQERKLKQAEVEVVIERLKAAAPRARQAGVILALENTLSARQNLDILERVGSEAVQVYYDVYNLAGQGYDTPAEIRLLRQHVACIHFKEGSNYLGQGKIKWEPVAAAIREIGYQGWIVLETSNPSKDGVADARRNAEFIRKLFGMA
jgi:L-ribulose-5-phosphate 3-epimerase